MLEKRKYLKGWHFQALTSINKNSSKSPLEKIAENADEAQAISLKKKQHNKINSLELLELNTLTNTIENKDLVGVSSSKKNSVKTPEKRLDKVKGGSKLIDKKTENGHLPNVPSAEIVESEGVNLGETARITMEKVEELTLYMIEQQEELDEQKSVIEAQQETLEEQRELIEAQKKALEQLMLKIGK